MISRQHKHTTTHQEWKAVEWKENKTDQSKVLLYQE
jgi:hypothetical protein